MSERSHEGSEFMDGIPTPLLFVIAVGWVAFLIAGIFSLWTGDWLNAGFYLAIWGFQFWILRVVQRGSQPTGIERVGLVALASLVLLVSIVMVLRRFIS